MLGFLSTGLDRFSLTSPNQKFKNPVRVYSSGDKLNLQLEGCSSGTEVKWLLRIDGLTNIEGGHKTR